jgi:hypothetical protein
VIARGERQVVGLQTERRTKEDKNEERLRKIEEAIALYQKSHDDLIRIGIVLLEQGEDLTELKNTIDGLGETEVKELLTITVAQVAHFYFENRQAAPSN